MLRQRITVSVAAFQIVTGNGFSGTTVVDNTGSAKVTLSIVSTGVLKGVGGGIVSAVAGTDYIVGVTASAPLSQSGGGTPNLSMTQSAAAVDGWLSHTDWNTFNNKQPALGYIPLNPANNLSDVASASTSRMNLGLGSMATQSAGAVAVTGGAIDGAAIGNSTPSTVKATTINSSGDTTVGGNVLVSTVGDGLRVKEGANAKQGTAVLAAGTVTVANTVVTAISRIFLTSQVDGGTPGFLRVSSRIAGTSFTVLSSSNTDTSTLAYEIYEPA